MIGSRRPGRAEIRQPQPDRGGSPPRATCPQSAPPGPALDPFGSSSPAPRRLALPGAPACLPGKPPPCGSPLAHRGLVSGEAISTAPSAHGRGLLSAADTGRPASHLKLMSAQRSFKLGCSFLGSTHMHTQPRGTQALVNSPLGPGHVGCAAGPCASHPATAECEGAGRIRSRTGAVQPGRRLDYLGIGCLFGPLGDAWHLSRDGATGYG